MDSWSSESQATMDSWAARTSYLPQISLFHAAQLATAESLLLRDFSDGCYGICYALLDEPALSREHEGQAQYLLAFGDENPVGHASVAVEIFGDLWRKSQRYGDMEGDSELKRRLEEAEKLLGDLERERERLALETTVREFGATSLEDREGMAREGVVVGGFEQLAGGRGKHGGVEGYGVEVRDFAVESETVATAEDELWDFVMDVETVRGPKSKGRDFVVLEVEAETG